MIKSENYIKKKYKLIIFDLDGVLIDSKSNMKKSWEAVKKEFKIKAPFSDYFKNIGMPFIDILKKIGIQNNHLQIQKLYSKISAENINRIKFYKDAEKVLKILKSRYKLAIVTSKDHKRTKLFLSKLNISFDMIVCPQKNLNGKPSPDQINFVLKKLYLEKQYSVYIGDTLIDKKAAKRAKIDFIFANYGFGNCYSQKVKKIYSLNNLLEIL
jgi:phosphoglycolate phosphatase